MVKPEAQPLPLGFGQTDVGVSVHLRKWQHGRRLTRHPEGHGNWLATTPDFSERRERSFTIGASAIPAPTFSTGTHGSRWSRTPTTIRSEWFISSTGTLRTARRARRIRANSTFWPDARDSLSSNSCIRRASSPGSWHFSVLRHSAVYASTS
jgi:hypothetical protein